MGAGRLGSEAGGVTHRARDDEREDPLASSPSGRRHRGEFVELLGLTLAAGAFVLYVVRPEASEALVRLAERTAAFAP